jgi:hypothetical protein
LEIQWVKELGQVQVNAKLIPKPADFLVQFCLRYRPVPTFWWHRLHLNPVREQFCVSLLYSNKETEILLSSSPLHEFSKEFIHSFAYLRIMQRIEPPIQIETFKVGPHFPSLRSRQCDILLRMGIHEGVLPLLVLMMQHISQDHLYFWVFSLLVFYHTAYQQIGEIVLVTFHEEAQKYHEEGIVPCKLLPFW